ncbi:MAG: tol-pal system-associated acyl-CoA thioesterase [Limnobacter sp.]|nr:tol-pal system-associated acyl-CoA thioesterase [Limnobacter sp.]
MTYALDIRVYFEDTDAAGVVYYGNYLKFMERARSQWFKDHSIGMKQLMDKHSAVFVVSHTELAYHRSARLEDLLSVTVQVERLRKASAVFKQEVFCNGQLLCSGKTRVGCVNTQTMRPVSIPAQVTDDLSRLACTSNS